MIDKPNFLEIFIQIVPDFSFPKFFLVINQAYAKLYKSKDNHFMIKKNKQDNKPYLILSPKKEFEEKLSKKTDSTGTRLFAGRMVKVRNAYILSDRFCEIIYLCTGNVEGANALLRCHNSQYLLNKTLKMFSASQISNEHRCLLKELILNSQTFLDKTKKVQLITPEDLITIRREVQSQQKFIDQAEINELLESTRETFPQKYLFTSGVSFKREFLKDALNLHKNDQTNLGFMFNFLFKHESLTKEDIIQCYEHYLKSQELPSDIRILILERLTKAYIVTNAFTSKIEITEQAIACCEQLLSLTAYEKTDPLNYKNLLTFLINLYHKNKDFSKTIGCCIKLYNTFPSYDLVSEIEKLARKAQKSENYIGAIEYYAFIVNLLNPKVPLVTRIMILK